MMSTQPGAATNAASSAGRARPLTGRTDRTMAKTSARLDGGGAGVVSRVDQLTGQVGLNDREVRVEDDQVRDRLRREDAVPDEAELARRCGGADGGGVDHRQAYPADQ